MNKSIASIVWPKRARDSVRLFLLYMIRVIEQTGVSFGSQLHDPVLIARNFLVEKLSEEERRSALAHWWGIVDERGVQNFDNRDALVARLAVCLLSPDEGQVAELGEQLSWFLEVLGFLGADVDKAIEVMGQHFDFVES